MNIGGAFKAAWDTASDSARETASAIATGAEKVKAAAAHGIQTTVETTVDAALWAAEQTTEAAEWVADKAEQGRDKAVELAKKAGQAVNSAFDSAVESFKQDVKALAAIISCAIRPPPLGESEARQARALLERLSAKDAKALSQLAYSGVVGETTSDETWQIVEVKDTGLTGYRAIVAKPTDPGDTRVALAFAGTHTSPLKAIPDVLTDADQHLGGLPPQYLQALSDAREIQMQYGDDLVLTGHSLGGGLGNFASETLGIPAVTVNSAPLGTGTQEVIEVFGPETRGSNSLTLATGHDLVSVVGAIGPPAHPGLVAPVSTKTSGNPLSDHSLDSFDPDELQLGAYDEPVPTPPIDSLGATQGPSLNLPPFD